VTLKKAREKVQSLMVWVRERPQMYASTVGELDAALLYLHMVWAMLADRENELNSAIQNSWRQRNTLKGYLKDSERTAAVDVTSNPTKKVLRFWTKVDRQLNVEVLCERWWD
jgi:hypothetical protein